MPRSLIASRARSRRIVLASTPSASASSLVVIPLDRRRNWASNSSSRGCIALLSIASSLSAHAPVTTVDRFTVTHYVQNVQLLHVFCSQTRTIGHGEPFAHLCQAN